MTYFFIDCSWTKLSTCMAWFCWGTAGKQKNFHHKISHFLPARLAAANYPVACGPCCLFPASCWKENHGSRGFGNSSAQMHHKLRWAKSLCRSVCLFPLMRKAGAQGFPLEVLSWWQNECWDMKNLSRGRRASLHVSKASWQALLLGWETTTDSTSPDKTCKYWAGLPTLASESHLCEKVF